MFKKVLMLALALVSFTTMAAEPWKPTKPIEIVVPYPPGGGADKWGRVVSRIFNDHGWESFVTNKPGADTTIGSNYVAGAPADGHTLYMASNGFLDANLASKEPPAGINYSEKSFTDIAQLGFGSFVLVVSNDVPVNNYEEFKTYIRKNPEKFNLGFWNRYTSPVLLEWARVEKLPKPTIIPYKGTAPQLSDLLGGHLLFAFDSWAATAPHYDANKLKIIAVLDSNGFKYITGKRPNLKLVDLSAKHPDLAVPIWHGMMGPSGIPPEAVKEINAVIVTALKNPAYYQELEGQNTSVSPGSPEDLNRTHTRLLKFFKKVNQ